MKTPPSPTIPRSAWLFALVIFALDLALSIVLVGSGLPLQRVLAVLVIKGATLGALYLGFLAAVLRRRGEAAGAESEAGDRPAFGRISDVIDVAPLPIIGSDEHFRITWWNPAAERLYGWTREEVLGRHVSDVVRSRTTAGQIEQAKDAVQQRDELESEWIHHDRSGSPLVILGNTIALRDARGRITGYVSVNRDVTGERRIEQALRESENRLRLIMDNMPGAMAYIDRSQRYVYANAGYEHLLGWWTEDMVGHTVAEVVGPEGYSIARPHIEATMNGEPQVFENRLPMAGGGKFAALVHLVPDITENGVAGLYAMITDLNTLREAQAAHARDLELLTQVMENTRTHLAYLDRNLTIVKVNSAFASKLGHPADELIGCRLRDVFLERESLPIFEGVLASGEPAEYRARPFMFPNGPADEVTYWDWWLVPVKDVTGELQGLVVSLSDVTEQKRGEEALRTARDELQQRVAEATADLRAAVTSLQFEIAERERAEAAQRESESQLRLLVGQVPAVIWTTDRDLKYTSSEGAGLALLKIAPGEMIGRPVASTGVSPEADTLIQAHRRALAGERTPYRVQWSGLTFEGYVEPLRGAAGDIDGCVGVALDISEQVRYYQLLEQRVQERTRELSSLLAFSRQASATFDTRALMNLVVEEVTHLVEATEVSLFMLEGNVLKRTAQRGLQTDDAAGETQIVLDEPDLTLLIQGDAGPVVLPDLAAGVDLPMLRYVAGRWMDQKRGLRSIMWVPLATKQTVTGGLCIAHTEPDRYSEHEAGLIQAIANQAAVAIENARLYEQAQALAVLQERQRLARELHDSVTQTLYSMSLMAEASRRLVSAGNVERGAAYLARIVESAQQVLREMRLLVYELRPHILQRDGLAGALRHRLETVESRTGIETSLVVEGSDLVPEHIETELYRIAQEALTNSLKHSGASAVSVRLHTTPEQITLTVSDNGRGFSPAAVEDTGGLGLVSMRERTHRLGGSLDVLAQPDKGVKVTVCIPTCAAGATGEK